MNYFYDDASGVRHHRVVTVNPPLHFSIALDRMILLDTPLVSLAKAPVAVIDRAVVGLPDGFPDTVLNPFQVSAGMPLVPAYYLR